MGFGSVRFLKTVAIVAAIGLPATAFGGAPSVLPDGVQLTAGEVVQLNVDAVPGLPFEIDVPIDGFDYVLDMIPHSVRSPRYQLLVQGVDGELTPAEPGIPRTYRGSVLDFDGGFVVGSLLEDGLTARVDLGDWGVYWIEPLSRHAAGAEFDEYVVYPDGATVCEGGCPLATPVDDPAMFPFPLYVPQSPATGPGPEVAFGDGASDCGGANGFCVAELLCDSDVEYFNDYGSVPNVEARIELVINTVNVQYENETDITHEIGTLVVRTSEPDPYSTTDPFSLLSQFRNQWLGDPNDVNHLFTGKNLNGGVIGIAWTIGGICNDNGFCLSESDFNNSFPCATDLTAHELGHLWGADHCTCTSNTMNPFITCANNFHDTLTVPDIVGHRDSRTCLEGEGGGGGIPCGDIMDFRARCNGAGTIQARARFTDNSHDGEMVTMRVDTTNYDVTIVNRRATLQIAGQGGTGAHSVELVDPSGCFGVVNINCN